MNSRILFGLLVMTGPSFSVRAQDPDIDRLLRRLPPPEKVVTQVASGRQKADPAAQDPVAQQLVKKLAAGKAGEGLNAARKLAKQYPLSPVVNFLHGTSALARNQSSEAVDAFRKSVSLAPQWADAHFGLGVAEGQRGRFAAALPPLQKATQLAPAQAPAFLFLSACLERLGRKQESANAARRATQLAPNVAGTWAQLARAESALGHRAESLLAAGKAFRLAPTGATVVLTTGVGALDVNRPVEGIRILERAVKLEPKNSLLQKQLKWFRSLAAQTNQTVARLQAKTASNPNSGPTWFELGLAYKKLERHREATEAFGKARRLMPASGAPRTAVANPAKARASSRGR